MALVEDPISAEEATALISKAKTIVESDMGVKASDMLAPEFRFLWQYNGELNRDQYLTAGKGPYVTLRTAFPDLFWNAYDYRVDKFDRNRVWLTTRMTGTHTGTLVFEGKQYAPTGKRLEASPECIGLVFDESTGLCIKMTGGFTLDRGAGNTRPAAGIWGVMKAIGEPAPTWKYNTPLRVIQDIFGPTFRPPESLGNARPPFRDAVSIALAKQVLISARQDVNVLEELLADDVQIYAPFFGPFKKKSYIEDLKGDLAKFFPELDVVENFYDGRVDPYEPSRVWLTARFTVSAPRPVELFGLPIEVKRKSYQAGPETFSVTFNEEGFVSKMTLGFPMDTELGESGGLSNLAGIMAGLGSPVPEIFSRPAPDSFRRFLSSVLPAKRKPSPKPPATSKDLPTVTKAAPAPKATPSRPAPKQPVSPAAPKAVASKVTPAKAKAAPGKARVAPAKVASPIKAASPTKPAATKPAATKPAVTKPAAKPAATKAVSSKGSPWALFGMGTPTPKASDTPTKATVAADKKAPAASAGATGAGASKAGASSSPFGGRVSLGGAGRKVPAGDTGEASKAPKGKDVVEAKAKASIPAKAPVAKKPPPEPVKKPAPSPAPVASKSGGVVFSPELIKKLESAAGSSQAVAQLSKRTDLYARGGISAMDYWGTLKKTLGPDGVQNLAPDVIGALPSGNQKSALFRIYSTGSA